MNNKTKAIKTNGNRSRPTTSTGHLLFLTSKSAATGTKKKARKEIGNLVEIMGSDYSNKGK